MRNINELIGVVKGINFDGIINDMEIVRLQAWVDKNRNLAYEPRQAELIRLVDDVLADHIITDEEREELVTRAEEFLEEIGDNSGKIYELNGIIEGVVCDGEVNEAEVYRLKEWMDIYGDLIRGHKSSEALCNAIDSILEDGIVTEEEQLQILDMLNVRIQNSQFETKLTYLCKQVKERKNIGTDLIDILDSEFAMTEIHKRAEAQIIEGISFNRTFLINQEIIVISLVLIAMLEYDGNFYGSVRSTYKEVYKYYSEQKVEGFLRTVLNKYKKQNDSGSRTRIINVALENAIVPQAFLTAFFEFIFDIYKMNFDFDLPEDLYEDFKFVFEGLRSNMLSEGDDISINVTQKTYKLIASTKRLITKEEGIDAVIKLSIIIVKLIDKRFWDKEVIIYNPYLKVGYEGWEKQLKEISRDGRRNRMNSSEFRSRWAPKYVMINNSIHIVPPAHRVRAQYDYRKLAVIVLNNDKELYRKNDCFIKEIIGGYQINPPEIDIEDPLGKLTYRLVCGDEIIYDSKDKLYRNYIVFNEEGQEINNNTDYEGTAYICYRAGEAELRNVFEKEYYSIGYKLVRLGDALGIGLDVFSFSSMVKPGVFGQLHEKCMVSVSEDKYLPVYKEVSVIVFEADNVSNKFEVVINGKSHKLSEMPYKTTTRDLINKYVVELGLVDSGIYSLEVNQIIAGRKNRILSEEFVLDAELTYEAEKANESLYKVKIHSGIMENTIDNEISSDDFGLEMISFCYGENTCKYLIPLNLGFYSVDGGAWKCATEELWIEDLTLNSTMRLFDSECDELLVYTENGTLAEENVVVKDRGCYKEISIGFLNSYRNANKYILLVFSVNGRKKYTMLCYNKCVLDEEGTEIVFSDNPKQIMITPIYHGKNQVFFEIFNKDGEKVYMSKSLKSGQSEVVEDFNSFEPYTINFHEKTKILMLRRNTLLYTVSKTFYARQDFLGKVFKIDIAYFDQFVKSNYVEKAYYFNKAYVRITGMLEKDLFEGHIFVKTQNGEWELKGINPVDVEICSDIIDDTMDVYMTNCGDGLLLDFEKHGILNSLEHPTAPDIFLYTIRMKGEI